MSRYDAQVILEEAYDETYGIFDHERAPAEQALAIIAHHEIEETFSNSLFTEYAKRYRINNVKKYFGLDFDTFMEYPMEHIEELLKICAEEVERDSKKAQSIQSDLDDLTDD